MLVAVTDTGTGIAPDVLESVFEPFFSTKPAGKGTGLGLSMVHGLVKQSGGHIKIYSELGEGTTIRFYLQRTHEAEDLLAEEVTVPVQGGAETILVVEDDDGVRDTAVGLLSELGYRVLKARDAQGGLAILESGVAIDLIFTDVVMPGPVRSPELARKAKERLPFVGVLFTSGYTQNAIVHHGRLDPGVELLSKPYTREALARKVRHVLANEAQRRKAAGPQDGGPAVFTPRPEPTTDSPRYAVLIVEDDALIRASTAEIVADMGHSVVEAGDGAAALAALERQTVDVMLTDVGLPDMSGVELARRALDIAPSLKVVFVTGDDFKARESAAPVSAIVQKPYTPHDLARALAALT